MDRITDEKVDKFLKEHLNPYDGIFVSMELYAKEHAVPIVQPEAARFISMLIKMNRPKRILEVGCAIGYSTLLFSKASPEAEILTIERDENMIKLANENIKKADKQNQIKILEGDACEIIPSLNRENKDEEKFDFIFLDAAKSRYNDFLPHCIRLLHKGGLLVCDNVLFRGMVARDYDEVPHAIRTIYYRLNEFHDALKANLDLESSVIPLGDGVSVSIRK